LFDIEVHYSGISGAGIDPIEVSHYPNLAENVIAFTTQ